MGCLGQYRRRFAFITPKEIGIANDPEIERVLIRLINI